MDPKVKNVYLYYLMPPTTIFMDEPNPWDFSYLDAYQVPVKPTLWQWIRRKFWTY